ncbi:MAG: LysR family transcriptional regulator [Burkholderiaceae bacterium]|nr:LysR family transcriptional regulator [Burkholderiaceae bacterium]
MKPTLNLRQVESFYAVMRTGTVIAAAQQLNVTQPVVSRAISLLETRIGYKLFERKGRRLVATPEGHAFFREAEPIFGSLDRLAQASQDIRSQRGGELRIGSMPSLSQSLLPRVTTRFLSSRPGVSVFVQSLPSRQVAEQVANRQLDIGLVELPLANSAISLEELPAARAVAVIPESHPLSKKKVLSVTDFDGEKMILLSRHSFLRYQIEDVFSRNGVSPNIVLETPHSNIACSFAAAGAGITLVSHWAAEAFSGASVARRPIKEELTSRSAIVFPYPGPRLKLAETFAKEIKKEFSDGS